MCSPQLSTKKSLKPLIVETKCKQIASGFFARVSFWVLLYTLKLIPWKFPTKTCSPRDQGVHAHRKNDFWSKISRYLLAFRTYSTILNSFLENLSPPRHIVKYKFLRWSVILSHILMAERVVFRSQIVDNLMVCTSLSIRNLLEPNRNIQAWFIHHFVH